MALPRVSAAIFVLLLIGTFALIGVAGVALLGPTLAHGNNVAHQDGTIVNVGPGMNFVLQTATGKKLQFQCSGQCRASLDHLLRHQREQAHTDVYYVRGPKNALIVVDVD